MITQHPLVLATRTYHALFVQFASMLQHPLLLVMRLYWGWQFFLTGKGKLGNIEGVTQFFDGLGIPMPMFNAYLVASLECVGGLLLLAGLGSRLIAIPLTIAMSVAYATAHREELSDIFSEPDKFLNAAPFLFLLTCVIVLIFGPGAFSLDAVIKRLLPTRASDNAKR